MTEPESDALRLLREGNDLEDGGKLAEARVHYLHAIAAAPASARPWLNLGNVLERQGQHADAIAAVRKAISLDGALHASYFNLGRLLQRTGDVEGAEHAFRAAIARNASFTPARICLADVLESRGLVNEAERTLRDAVDVDPTDPGASYNLALMLIEREAFDEAESLLARCIASSPAFAMAYDAMGTVKMRGGHLKEAETWYRQRLHLDPTSVECAGAILFSLLARDDLDARSIYAVHRDLARLVERPRLSAANKHGIDEPRAKRIRIGYLSPDFRQHAVAVFIEPVIASHDRSAFEVFCYNNHRGEDAVGRRLRSLAEHWRDVAFLDDAAAADVIRADRIDILIDLAGHTAGSRLSLFQYRCAPVQATWLGYLHSTGFVSADYRISDAHTDPPGETEDLHTEKLVRMPHSQWCYRPWRDAPSAAASSERRPGPITFGSFNQFWKISETCLRLWAQLLEALPASRIRMLAVPRGRITADFEARLTARGLPVDRFEFRPRVGMDDYFSAIGSVDVALDSMPYNGATTTLDTLWMGVPIVGLAGERSISRSSVSILTTLGLRDLIAASATEYVDLNIRLARDTAWRQRLRRELRGRMLDSPLMDEVQFTRDLEERLRQMLAAKG